MQADLVVYGARLEMSRIRSPVKAQILSIYTKPGERVGPNGFMELGATDKMAVIAEVYETDINRVKEGQTAIISSPALDAPVRGEVVHIALKVGKLDVIGADPIAKTDARVVETTILLDNSELLAGLTNLQVEVEIHP